jgi:hypothetical protein
MAPPVCRPLACSVMLLPPRAWSSWHRPRYTRLSRLLVSAPTAQLTPGFLALPSESAAPMSTSLASSHIVAYRSEQCKTGPVHTCAKMLCMLTELCIVRVLRHYTQTCRRDQGKDVPLQDLLPWHPCRSVHRVRILPGHDCWRGLPGDCHHSPDIISAHCTQ